MKKKKSLLLIILILLVGLTAGYVSTTYAKYASLVENEGEAKVAKWDFTRDNPSKSIEINLDKSYDPSTLVDDRIAPGTSGSFDIQIKNGTTETGVNFTVELEEIANMPTNLEFYKDEEHTVKIVPGSDTITGQLAAQDSTGVTVSIYWEWPYGDSDEVDNSTNVTDTTDGSNAESLSIKVNLKGVQTEPGEDGITSHID